MKEEGKHVLASLPRFYIATNIAECVKGAVGKTESGAVSPSIQIAVFVLGSKVEPLLTTPMTSGCTTIHCRQFDVVMQQAHARTFNLSKHLEKMRKLNGDQDIESILG